MTIVSDRDFDSTDPEEEPTDSSAESAEDLPDDEEATGDDVDEEFDDEDGDDEPTDEADDLDDEDDDEPTDEAEVVEDEDDDDEPTDEAEVVEDKDDDDTSDSEPLDEHEDDDPDESEPLDEHEDDDPDESEQRVEDRADQDDVGDLDDKESTGVEVPVDAVPEQARVELRADAPDVAGLPTWSYRQMTQVTRRVLAVLAVTGLIGLGLGALRGDSNIARTEFVYTLDQSVPDSFLREDRRLLTQVVTFESDSVLTPVAERFDLTVEELRSKIDVETLDLSEVIRLDVSDPDPARAIAISRAVLDRYLEVITDAAPAGDSGQELLERRTEVTEQLAQADATRRDLLERRQQDVILTIEQEAIQRQIDLKNEQINRMQGSLDDSLVQILSAARRARLIEELDLAQQELAALESELVGVGQQRAALATATTTEPALLREIERLESQLVTIDDELAERELAPLIASPIRELSQPLIVLKPARLFALQGLAIGLLAGVPVAAVVAYRTRKRQLWFA